MSLDLYLDLAPCSLGSKLLRQMLPQARSSPAFSVYSWTANLSQAAVINAR